MLEFVIPCLLGLESLVGDEIKKLGLSDVRVENGRVLCRGEARDIARLNINLRCGARVILVLHKFRATDFESLFQGVRAVHWAVSYTHLFRDLSHSILKKHRTLKSHS